jgi:hypothetical protein
VQQSKRRNTNFPLATKSWVRAGERTPPLHRAQPLPRISLDTPASQRASSRSNYELKKSSGLINFMSAHRRLAFFINRQADAASTCPPRALITMKNAAPEIFQAVRKLQQTRRRAECKHKHFPSVYLSAVFSIFFHMALCYRNLNIFLMLLKSRFRIELKKTCFKYMPLFVSTEKRSLTPLAVQRFHYSWLI